MSKLPDIFGSLIAILWGIPGYPLIPDIEGLEVELDIIILNF